MTIRGPGSTVQAGKHTARRMRAEIVATPIKGRVTIAIHDETETGAAIVVTHSDAEHLALEILEAAKKSLALSGASS